MRTCKFPCRVYSAVPLAVSGQPQGVKDAGAADSKE